MLFFECKRGVSSLDQSRTFLSCASERASGLFFSEVEGRRFFPQLEKKIFLGPLEENGHVLGQK